MFFSFLKKKQFALRTLWHGMAWHGMAWHVVVVVVVTCCYLLLLVVVVVAGNQTRRTFPPNDKSQKLRGPSAWNAPHHEGGYHCSMPQVEKPIHPWKV